MDNILNELKGKSFGELIEFQRAFNEVLHDAADKQGDDDAIFYLSLAVKKGEGTNFSNVGRCSITTQIDNMANIMNSILNNLEKNGMERVDARKNALSIFLNAVSTAEDNDSFQKGQL